MFLSCCVRPDPKLKDVLAQAKSAESSDIAKSILSQLEQNIDAADKKQRAALPGHGHGLLSFWI